MKKAEKMAEIVIPVEFGEVSQKTVNYGIGLAGDLKLDVRVIHVVKAEHPGLGRVPAKDALVYPPEVEERKSEAEGKMKVFIKKLQELPAGVSLSHEVRPGYLSNILAEESGKDDTQLLLVNAEGDGKVAEGIKNEIVQALLEGSKCPVIVLTAKFDYKKIRNILYATDFQKEDIGSIKELVSIAREFDAYILALHITDSLDFKKRIEEKGFRESLAEKVGYKHIRVMTMPSDNVAEGIASYARKMDVEVIALLKENEGFWKRLFGKSTTRKLFKETDLPLIVFNEKKHSR